MSKQIESHKHLNLKNCKRKNSTFSELIDMIQTKQTNSEYIGYDQMRKAQIFDRKMKQKEQKKKKYQKVRV